MSFVKISVEPLYSVKMQVSVEVTFIRPDSITSPDYISYDPVKKLIAGVVSVGFKCLRVKSTPLSSNFLFDQKHVGRGKGGRRAKGSEGGVKTTCGEELPRRGDRKR